MFKRILVPVDGSQRAEAALSLAARIARATNGELWLMHAVTMPGQYKHVFQTADEILQISLDAAACSLSLLREQQDVADLSVQTRVRVGDAAASILAIAQEEQCDLIVLCHHSVSDLHRWPLGSVAQKVACHSSIPVLVTSEHGYIPSGPFPDASRPLRPLEALVALDGSEEAEAVLLPTAYLVSALTNHTLGALHLVRVVKRAPLQDACGFAEMVERAKFYLDETARKLREDSITLSPLTVTCGVITGQDVAGGLLRAAEEGEYPSYGGYDLIALATHRWSGIAHLIQENVAERLLHTTKFPLLILHPPLPMQASSSRKASNASFYRSE